MTINGNSLRRVVAPILTLAVAIATGAPAAAARTATRRHLHRTAFTHRYRYTLGDRVEAALRADRNLAGARARADARGAVVLSGTVFDDAASRQAVLTASRVRGVRRVEDRLTTVTGQWMTQQKQINAALLQVGALQNVSAHVVGDRAYLWGDVHSESDKEQAARVAASFSKLHVVNLVRVVPGPLFSLPGWL
ncbi:MAG TPA: BON domain-containing protein [Candidatus Binataceae bacterium]|jgi:osmotically-inducible protein OsmY|nr:BON domain-containing protein [Candidatus Binataceae bacterium]